MGDRSGQNGPKRNVVEEPLFELLLYLEVQKAIRLQYCISVACLTPDLLAEELDPSLPRRFAESTVRCLRSTDVVTMLSQSSIGLLLIDADTRQLPQILNRATDAAQALGAQGRRVSWSGGATCYPETATSVKELLRQARDLMERAKAEGGDRLYLAS